MRHLLLSSLFGITLLSFGCSPTDTVINSFDETWTLATTSQRGLAFVSMPSGTQSSEFVWGDFPNSFSNITVFRDRMYALNDWQTYILVLDATTTTVVDTLFTTLYEYPNDIAFANATTAYVAMKRYNVLLVMDLTTGFSPRVIELPGKATSVACFGNQVCAVIPEKNTAVLIDTRTNEITKSLQTAASPFYVGADAANENFVVVCLGDGKINASAPSNPIMQFVRPEAASIIASVDISGRATNASMQRPRGLLVTANEEAFVPVQNGLIRVSTRTRSKASIVQFESYDGIYANPARAELMTVRHSPEGSTIDVFDEFAENIKYTFVRPDSVRAVAGVAK
jgi:hypothetical protein